MTKIDATHRETTRKKANLVPRVLSYPPYGAREKTLGTRLGKGGYHSIFISTRIGQYKTWTADYGLGIKYGLGINSWWRCAARFSES